MRGDSWGCKAMRTERLITAGTMTATRRHRPPRLWLLRAAEAVLTLIALALMFGVVAYAVVAE